jgi:hypothetical protein
MIVLWRFATVRATSPLAERRAQQLIAVSFYAIALYIAVDAVRALATGDHPDVSWVGIGLSAVTLVTMPPLAIAKARVAEALGSSATKSESRQTMLCALPTCPRPCSSASGSTRRLAGGGLTPPQLSSSLRWRSRRAETPGAATAAALRR